MLQIQADAHCDDWPGLVQKCQEAYATTHDLGLWAPLVYWTPWTLSRTSLERTKNHVAHRVSMVDGIVWALGAKTVHRMRELDYSINPLGRGIDLAAASFAMAHGLPVVVDSSVRVKHPRGSGYSEAEANNQLRVFLNQLDSAEKLAHEAIQNLQIERIKREKKSFSHLANRLYRHVSNPLYRSLRPLLRAFGKELPPNKTDSL